ncbi:MAG TPA: glycine cleavage system protein GcvH [Ignisphaera sp.]|nr:glycine cleavage system protein GcvH [Ignisphaera sp.]
MVSEIFALNKYRVPTDRLYTKTHEWIKVEDDVAIIGITDYAQQKLRNIVGIELPEVGKEYSKGERIGVVESIKSVEDVYAPVTFKVLEINERLADEPDLINRDPYGEGWIAKVKILRREELDELMKAEDYVKHIEKEEAH